MSKRQDIETQKELEPKRIEYAIEKLTDMGFNVVKINDTTIKFIYKNHWVTLFPYSGWYTGKSIKDGRGIDNLLKQLQ